MARRRRRKKNPSAAQWAVITIGGLGGLGLLGWGIYELTRPASAAQTPDGALGLPGATYEYEVTALTSQQRAARATVYLDGQIVRFFIANTRKAASDRARKWIEKQGGVAVCTSGCPQGVTTGLALPPV